VPVLCGSAFKNKGVQPLLDAVVDYCRARSTSRRSRASSPTATRRTAVRRRRCAVRALAFKIMNDPFVGSLTFTRIYSGKLSQGQVLNSVKDKKEKVGRMLLMHANRPRGHRRGLCRRHRRLAGMKDTTTGDTLCDPPSRSSSSGWNSPIRSSSFRWSPRPRPTRRRWASRSTAWPPRIPRFRVSTDHESGQTIIKGMGELHLDILVDRMKREFKVEANVGAPQVAYRESLAKPVEVDLHPQEAVGRLGPVRRGQGQGHAGRARLRASPSIDEIKGGNIPREYIPSVEKGMREQAESGSLIGFPIIDFDIKLIDGKYHDVDSSRPGVRDHRPRRDARSGPEGRHQAARADHEGRGGHSRGLSGRRHRRSQLSRRGQIQGTDSRGNAQVVEAMVPLANMFGYVNELRSFSQGRAQYTMQFSHYDEVPANVAAEVKEKLA
jgi:elongation factor G